MSKSSTQITNLKTLKGAQLELESVSKAQRTNILVKADHLKATFFLKTDKKKYNFDQGQKITPELLKLLLKKVFKPKFELGKTITILVSTFFVQSYGKKLTKRLKKMTSKFLT